jgi:hypothetical protein
VRQEFTLRPFFGETSVAVVVQDTDIDNLTITLPENKQSPEPPVTGQK